MKKLIVVGAGWLLCGIIAHGLVFGYFRTTYPQINSYWSDFFTSAIPALLGGPIALIAGVLFVFWGSIHGYQGFRLW